jgi:hypothetical protein
MRITYRVLAFAVAAEVAVQAVVMVWAVAGLGKWIQGGGVADAAMMQSEGTPFPEVLGFMLHGINGTFVVPSLALLLLIISFFTRIRGAITWAAIVFVLTVLQGQLGFLGHEVPLVGGIHGLNAMLMFVAALYAGLRMRRVAGASIRDSVGQVGTPVSSSGVGR